MDLPEGRLLRQRVLRDIATAFRNALDQDLTGYARLEPQETLLLDGQAAAVLVFDGGIPVAAYHTGRASEGEQAVTDIASSGPFRLELYELDGSVVERITESDDHRISPTLPAKQLTRDPHLLERTRERVPESSIESTDDESGLDAVENFLDDGDRIEEIRERARAEAESRAAEWGLPTE